MRYLDHNATSPLRPSAAAAMTWARSAGLGHPGALHRPGRRAAAVVEDARAAVAELVGASPGSVVLTSGGTEANVTALHHLVTTPGRPHLLAGATEHSAVLAPLRVWADAGRCTLSIVPVDRWGAVDLTALADLLPGAQGLALMAANNETGVLHDLEAVSALVMANQVWWHCDAVAAVGRIPVRLDRAPWSAVDSLALAGHKLGGPAGTGALVCRGPITPLLPGHGPMVTRAGTPDVAGLAGLAAAAREAKGEAGGSGARAARDLLERALCDRYPGTVVHGRDAPRLSHTSAIALHTPWGWVDGEAVAAELALRDIAVGTGAACATGTGRPSHVHTAAGAPPEVASATLRFSWGYDADPGDVEAVLDALTDLLGEHLCTP